MHLKRLEEQMRLMTHPLSQTLELGTIKVVLQDGLVVGMRALVDNDAGTFSR